MAYARMHIALSILLLLKDEIVPIHRGGIIIFDLLF